MQTTRGPRCVSRLIASRMVCSGTGREPSTAVRAKAISARSLQRSNEHDLSTWKHWLVNFLLRKEFLSTLGFPRTTLFPLGNFIDSMSSHPHEKNRDPFLPLRGAWSSVRVFRKEIETCGPQKLQSENARVAQCHGSREETGKQDPGLSLSQCAHTLHGLLNDSA